MKKEKILFVFLILFLNLFFISSSFISFVSAGELRVTQEHPFLVNDSWMSAKNLNVGDELFTIDGKKVRITEIEEVVSDKSFLVYNFEAKKYSDFVVCSESECDNNSFGVVVHNSNAPEEIFHATNELILQNVKESGFPPGTFFAFRDNPGTYSKVSKTLGDSAVRNVGEENANIRKANSLVAGKLPARGISQEQIQLMKQKPVLIKVNLYPSFRNKFLLHKPGRPEMTWERVLQISIPLKDQEAEIFLLPEELFSSRTLFRDQRNYIQRILGGQILPNERIRLGNL